MNKQIENICKKPLKKILIPDSDKIGIKIIKLSLRTLPKTKLETIRTMVEFGLDSNNEPMPEKYKNELLIALKKQYKKRQMKW